MPDKEKVVVDEDFLFSRRTTTYAEAVLTSISLFGPSDSARRVDCSSS